MLGEVKSQAAVVVTYGTHTFSSWVTLQNTFVIVHRQQSHCKIFK